VSFQITGPGFYMTRDGRRAEVIKPATGCGRLSWGGFVDGEICVWWENGSRFDGKLDPCDLISPWEEPVAAKQNADLLLEAEIERVKADIERLEKQVAALIRSPDIDANDQSRQAHNQTEVSK